MAETFDRLQRRYRLFDLEDGGAYVWFTVDASNMPADRLTPEDALALEAWLEVQPWREDFWRAFNTHKKATIYGDGS